MANFVIIGAGIGGMSAAYELREALGHRSPHHRDRRRRPLQLHAVQSLAGGGLARKPPTSPCRPAEYLAKKEIDFLPRAVTEIDAEENIVVTAGRPAHRLRLSADLHRPASSPSRKCPALGPAPGHTQSVCTTPHAASAWAAYQEFLKNPGPIVVGAVQGASCFGPAYEFAMILDADLRKRKLRDKVPMTFVTSEPYIGHMGLGGVGDSKGLMESEMRQRHIKWITNAKVDGCARRRDARSIEHDEQRQPMKEHVLPFAYSMLLPAFKGVRCRSRRSRACAIRAASC